MKPLAGPRREIAVHLRRAREGPRRVDDRVEALVREEIQHAGIRVALAVVAGCMGLSAALLLATWAPAPWGLPLLGPATLAVGATSVMALVFLGVHAVAAARLHPREWRRRLLALFRFFLGKDG